MARYSEMIPNSWYYKFKKISNRLFQPLTLVPTNPNSLVSDLFIWRRSAEIDTFFELINLPSLFSEGFETEEIKIFLFDRNGKQIDIFPVPVLERQKKTIEISNILPKGIPSDYGTFSIFHEGNPEAFRSSNSFLTERGYLSYGKKNHIRSFMHGNLDALAWSGRGLQPLGGTSFTQRRYNLQYRFSDSEKSEIGLVNPTGKNQIVKIQLIDSDFSVEFEKKSVIPPLGSYIWCLPRMHRGLRVSIQSKLIMARPVVFISRETGMDVFHG